MDSKANSDDSSDSSDKSSSEKTGQSGTFLVSDTTQLPPSVMTTELPMINEDFVDTDSPKIILAMSSNDTDTSSFSDSLRRSSRKRTPNTKYSTDYISPTISPTTPRIVSPKRLHSPSTASASSVPEPPVAVPKFRKKAKHSPLNSPSRQQVVLKRRAGFTNIGTLQLAWPRYGIRNSTFEGKVYSVTNTCPLDTGLFVMYYAYKAGKTEFRDLFERDAPEIYTILRRTFQLVDIDGWINARLYWLTIHNLLNDNDEESVHDIENTLTEIVFKFIQPMQKHEIKSKCSCDACPKPLRCTTSCDIGLV